MLAGHTDGLPAELTRLSTTGLLCDCAPRRIEQWIEAACAAGLIAMSADQYHTLTVTPFDRDAMAGRVEDVRMLVPHRREQRSLGLGADLADRGDKHPGRLR